MASRNIKHLAPHMADLAREHVARCKAAGLDILIYCTHRSIEEQARLYRNGRSIITIQSKAKQLREIYNRPDLADLLISVGPQHGPKKKTNAGPGESAHNYGLAFDAVPMRDGKPIWQEAAPEWQQYGAIGTVVGLEWSGTWRGFSELPHMQDPTFDWREHIYKI